MKRNVLLINCLILFLFTPLYAQTMVEWDSPEGLMRLQSSQSKENFWKLNRYYESQIRLTFCGVAASVLVLNSLSIKAPPSKFLGKYSIFTQEEFFSEEVKKIVDKSDVERRGVNMREIVDIFKAYGLQATQYEAIHLSHEQIRSFIIPALKNPSQRVLALYQRKALEQQGSGHWSPIVAYDEGTDSFLVMDVAKFKYPPMWIEATALFNAMQTTDSASSNRGFVIVEKIEKKEIPNTDNPKPQSL